MSEWNWQKPPRVTKRLAATEVVLRKHRLSPASGGTGTGSRWTCSCGETGLVNSTRDTADYYGRIHLAKALEKTR